MYVWPSLQMHVKYSWCQSMMNVEYSWCQYSWCQSMMNVKYSWCQSMMNVKYSWCQYSWCQSMMNVKYSWCQYSWCQYSWCQSMINVMYSWCQYSWCQSMMSVHDECQVFMMNVEYSWWMSSIHDVTQWGFITWIWNNIDLNNQQTVYIVFNIAMSHVFGPVLHHVAKQLLFFYCVFCHLPFVWLWSRMSFMWKLIYMCDAWVMWLHLNDTKKYPIIIIILIMSNCFSIILENTWAWTVCTHMVYVSW